MLLRLRQSWLVSLIGNIAVEGRYFVFVTTIFGVDFGTVLVICFVFIPVGYLHAFLATNMIMNIVQIRYI